MARTAVCTQAQVLQTAGFSDFDEVGGSDVVIEAIEEAESEVGNDYGDPYRKSTFILDSSQTGYEIITDYKKIHEIKRVVRRADDNSQVVYTSAASASESSKNYVFDNEFNKITFEAATSGSFSGQRVEIDFVPIHVHHLTRLKAALFLLDSSIITHGQEQMPAKVQRIVDRIKRIEDSLTPAAAIGSEDEKYYDPTYGDQVPQRRFFTY